MSKLKTTFTKARVIAPLHTGGPVAVTSDEAHLATCVGDEVVLTRLKDGQVLSRLPCDNETIHSLCFTPSSSHLVVFTASMTMFIFEEPIVSSVGVYDRITRPTRVVPRAHDAPVHVCKFEPSSTLLASGSADGIVKVWDIRRGYATHAFKGHGGVVSALSFRSVQELSQVVSSEPSLHLITGSVDTRIRIFDLSPSANRVGNSKAIAVLEGHMSVPRGLDVSKDGKWLISGGRDSVVLIWDLGPLSRSLAETKSQKKKVSESRQPTLVRTITVMERVESVGFVDEGGKDKSKPGCPPTLYTGGEKGIVKLWDSQNGTCFHAFHTYEAGGGEQAEEQRGILDAWYIPSTNSIASVYADQNILFHSVSALSLSRQLIGFNDEIIDAVFLSSNSADSHIAVAANSSLIRVYSVEEYDTRLLSGHANIVLCLDRSTTGRHLASGSKDKTARIWSFMDEKKSWLCAGVCEGHAESVGAVTLSNKVPLSQRDHGLPSFMFTGSQDCTIKLWDLSSLLAISDIDKPIKCKSLSTHKAHDKDINALDVSPNDQYLASASQDRTAKIFEIQYSSSAAGSKGDIKLLGVCKGHKRGVWTVRFGNSERVLATGSGDKTIKLWNLDDFSCVKTFESHTNSVLQIRFLNRDMQLASSASDGLLKLWNVRTDECVGTMDNHTNKVWALAVGTNESTIITGGADSVLTFWRDCSKEMEQEKEEKRAETVQKEQDLANYLSLKDYAHAISLALAMDQPGRLLSIFTNIITASDDVKACKQKSFSGDGDVDTVIRNLPYAELAVLMRRIRDWNSSARTSVVAQVILNAVLRLRSTEDVAGAFASTAIDPTFGSAKEKRHATNEIIPSLIPYTERHLSRLDRLIQESYVLDIILGEMDDGLDIQLETPD